MGRCRVAAVVCALLGGVVVPVPLGVPAPAYAEPTVATAVIVSSVGTVRYHDVFTLGGQVVYTDPVEQQQFALTEVTVRLDRRYLGSSTWTALGTDVTAGAFPAYAFDVTAQKNAVYRVTFAGDDTYQASAAKETVHVRRRVPARVVEPRENAFYLVGRVVPSYAGKRVYLMRRTCSSCPWKTLTSQLTSDTSRYRFRLPLPKKGTHYFRARVPASTSYVKSVSVTWNLSRVP